MVSQEHGPVVLVMVLVKLLAIKWPHWMGVGALIGSVIPESENVSDF